MQVTEKKISELRPYEHNAKTHGARQIEKIAQSIQRYGFRNPVLIDKDGTIIAGHGRVEAAKKLGMSSIPVLCYDDMTPEEVREYRIADNRLAEIGDTGWDFEALDFELSELDFGELDLEFEMPEAPDFWDFEDAKDAVEKYISKKLRVVIGAFFCSFPDEANTMYKKTLKLTEDDVKTAVFSLIEGAKE